MQALAQDQLRALCGYFLASGLEIRTAVRDGDVPPAERDTHALVEGDVLAAWPPVAGG